MVSFFFYFTITLFILVCVILVLLILIQKGRGGGLSGAFGGSGGNTAFGAKTGDVLTWATSIIFGVFVLLAIALNLLTNYRHDHVSNGLGLAAGTVVVPPATGAPMPAPSATPPANPDPIETPSTKSAL